ncbi:MAG: tryptophan synthase subunit alpha [Phormidesmis sp.]
MTTVSERFTELRQQRQCALIPFIMAGDPDLETTAAALQVLDRSGADLIELGVPYSDPLADGPVIQAAATRALQRGIQLDQVLEMVSSVGPKLRSPLILFTYYNPILNHGVESFLDRIKLAGVQGLVIPDLPLEESKRLLDAAAERDVEVILLVAPTSSPARMKAIAQASQGFVYLVSVTGVTGMRQQMGSNISGLLGELRSHTSKPIGVGFGISTGEQARQMQASGADAVIVGSAFVNRLTVDSQERLESIEDFCRQLKQSMMAVTA